MAIKYYLGLDLGISSCGWAVMAEDSNLDESDPEKYWLDDFGVRLFDPVEIKKTGVPLAADRREHRSTRRLNNRRQTRVKTIKWLFEKYGIVTRTEINNFMQSLTTKDGKYKITNALKFDPEKYINPYFLRVQAQDGKVSKLFLAYIVINIAKHRGYLNKFSFEEDEKSKLYDAFNQAKELTKDSKLTISKAIVAKAKADQEKNKKLAVINVRNRAKSTDDNSDKKEANYRYLFSRQLLLNELEIILKKQASFYPEITPQFIQNILETVGEQRDFEVGPGPKDPEKYKEWTKSLAEHHNFTFKRYVGYDNDKYSLTGFCKYYPKEKVGYQSSVLFDLFHAISEASKLTVTLFEIANIQLIHNNFINYLLYEYEKGNSPKKELKQIILDNLKPGRSLTSKTISNNKAYKNIEIKVPYISFLKEQFGNDVFKRYPINLNDVNSWALYDLGKIINRNITPERRAKELKAYFVSKDLTIDNLDSFLGYKKVKTSSLSFKAMQNLLIDFLTGEPVNKALQSGKYIITPKDRGISKQFLGPIMDSDLMRNNTVFRAVNQFRKVLKALYNRYHQFETINLETANELAKSASERKKLEKRINDNAKFNEALKAEMIKFGIQFSFANLLKYRLWKSQGRVCIYSGKEITLDHLKNSQDLEIDHIIPISQLTDDSFNNKVLTFKEYNQSKGNRVPLEWMEKECSQDFKKQFMNRVIKYGNTLGEKKSEYLLTESLDSDAVSGFVSRNLNDTRYITTYILTWLQDQIIKDEQRTGRQLIGKDKGNHCKILPIKGGVTSRFRRKWLISSPWGTNEKTILRDITNWHHAIDAIILASFKNKSFIAFATDLLLIDKVKRQLDKAQITRKEYEEAFADILKKYQQGHVHVRNAYQELLKLKEASADIELSPTIKNLPEVVNKRIPVRLKLDKQEIKITKNQNDDSTQQEENLGKPKFKKVPILDPDKFVLTETEYKAETQGMKGHIHYPYISYMVINKIRGKITGSENPLTKKEKQKLPDEKRLVDDANNTWSIASYHGFTYDPETKAVELVKKYDIQKDPKKYLNKNLYTPYWMFKYNLNGRWYTVIYTGITGKRFLAMVNGLTTKALLPGYESRLKIGFNKFNKNELLPINQPNILGEKV